MKRAILTIAALLLVASPARAFIVLKNFNGETEKWSGSSVTWTMSTSVMNDVSFDALQGALQAAFTSWQNVACATVTFSYGGQKASDPQNGIHFTFRQNGWDPSVADALAYSVSETSSNGTITSNDIVFNAFDVEWSTTSPTPSGKYDIQGVATHESGHSLGLDHSRVFAATMFFTGGSVDIRTLDDDDSRGLCFLYPTTPFTSGQACDACDTTANCAGGTCLDWGAGHSYCGKNCGGAAGACPAGFQCYNVDGVATPQCLPDNDGDDEVDFCQSAGQNVGLGGACYGSEVCASGQCLVLEDEAYCSESCNDANPASCADGFTCLPPGLCVKAGSSPYGSECQESTECQSAECVFFQFSVGVCTQGCGAQGGGGTCPGGNRCYEDAACVPPGDLGNGAPCYAPDQCKGMFCEDSKCTTKCSGAAQCAVGTDCAGGFCVGSEVGAPCTATGKCADGLTCQKPSAESLGTCERQCDAFTDLGCPDGEACEWRWQAWNEKVVGRCVAENGGQGLGASCADVYCEADLVCRFEQGIGPVCHRDCRISDGYGCDVGEDCESLADAADPQHGICIAPVIVEPEPGPEPGPEPTPDTVAEADDDTSVTTEPTTSDSDTSVATDTTTPTETGGADTSVSVGRSAGGCAGGREGGAADGAGVGAGIALGLIGVMMTQRWRRRSA